MKKIIFTLLLFSAVSLAACDLVVSINGNTDKQDERIVQFEERQQITKDFIKLMEEDRMKLLV